MDRIKRRRDFLAAARGRSWSTRGVVVQSRDRCDEAPARVGFTVTKKLGNAVSRNRIKRRLREAMRRVGPEKALIGHDYVLIGRRDTAQRPFEKLIGDIDLALEHLNKGETQPMRRSRNSGRRAKSGNRAN
jgi:ribonuclease P protein component